MLEEEGPARLLGPVCAGAIAAFLELGPATAHEFWITAENYVPNEGSRVVAGLAVGELMRGAAYPYLSDKFRSFTITTRDGTRDAAGFEGDIPALSYVATPAGLHVIAYEAMPEQVTFDTWEEFVDYLDYEGLGAIAEAHLARGLPRSGITEIYTRYAKSIIQVGAITPDDRDRPRDFRFEIVVADNPYLPGLTAVPVTLLWLGGPVAGRQIAVFQNDGEVHRSLVTTDPDGNALVPLAGGGEFMLNAVHIEPVLDDDRVMWASHWASVTFGLPTRGD